MRRARSCWWWCSVLAAGLSLICIAPIDAALFTLMPGDRDESVRVGRRSVTTEDWGGEWRVDGGAGQFLTVMTPFHRLALAARNSAFQDKELKPREVDSVLKDQQNKVVFFATLRGAGWTSRASTPPCCWPGAVDQGLLHTRTSGPRSAARTGSTPRAASTLFPAEGVEFPRPADAPGAGPRRKVVAKFTIDLLDQRYGTEGSPDGDPGTFAQGMTFP